MHAQNTPGYMVERNTTPMPTQVLGGRGSGGMEKGRIRYWPRSRVTKQRTSLGGAAHVQPYNRLGSISADLSRAECGFAPGRALPC